MTTWRTSRLHWGALLLSLCTVSAVGGCFADPGDSSSVRTAVVAGLVASSGKGVSANQAATFQGDIRGSWAIAYDPADPPGCTPGGLWGLEGTPQIPARACTAYVLIRRKSRWAVTAVGTPGSFVAPEHAPNILGDPSRLIYLAP